MFSFNSKKSFKCLKESCKYKFIADAHRTLQTLDQKSGSKMVKKIFGVLFVFLAVKVNVSSEFAFKLNNGG